jgi:2-polyprenyl-6-methoxyphenol hydroxylase-like FAD-dependent oxidoreductase
MSRGTAVVVGGGIGGLAAAAGLNRIGWPAVVLEQAPAITEVGAGLSLWPNALRSLDALGIGEQVRFLVANASVLGVHYADERAEVQRRVTGWHEPIAGVLEATEPDQVSHHDFFRLDPVPNYVHGRIALLGDAAHAQTPDLGQGACQAIEDAVVLAASLTEHSDPQTALARYDEQRRPRTQAMARAAYQQSQLYARYFRAVAATARVMPPSLWRRQITRWTDWTPPAITPSAAASGDSSR